MNLQRLLEHTFDVDTLKDSAWVLDVGCRDFKLANRLLDMGCRVVGMDPDRQIRSWPDDPNFRFIRKALVAKRTAIDAAQALFRVPEDAYGAYVDIEANPVKTNSNECYPVDLTHIERLSKELGVVQWEAVKLDCEGSEYDILLDWPGPIARQISVEFHDHLHTQDLTEVYRLILLNLGEFYDVHQWERHGKSHGLKNYWDVLFTLKT